MFVASENSKFPDQMLIKFFQVIIIFVANADASVRRYVKLSYITDLTNAPNKESREF